MSLFTHSALSLRSVLTGAFDILFGLLPTAVVYMPRFLPLFLGTTASILFLLSQPQGASRPDPSLISELAAYSGYSIAGLVSVIALWLAVVANHTHLQIPRPYQYLLSLFLSVGLLMDVLFYQLFGLFRASLDPVIVSTYRLAIAAHSLVSLRYLYKLLFSRMAAAA